MSNHNMSKFLVVATALAVYFLFNCNRASAVIVDVLAGVEWSSEVGLSGNGSNNLTDEPLTFTDGATHTTSTSDPATYEYILYSAGATVVYNLETPQRVNQLGIWDGLLDIRGAIATMHIDFSNDPTFTSGVTTDVVNLANNLTPTTSSYFQTVPIGGATAQYVRFDFLPGVGNYYVQSDPFFAIVSELQLSFVPEPASLGLIGVGGLMLLRRRRA